MGVGHHAEVVRRVAEVLRRFAEGERRGGEGGARSKMRSRVADGHATRRATTSERHIMILRKRDARQEVAKAVEKMLGVRRAQVGSANDLLKLDSLVDL